MYLVRLTLLGLGGMLMCTHPGLGLMTLTVVGLWYIVKGRKRK